MPITSEKGKKRLWYLLAFFFFSFFLSFMVGRYCSGARSVSNMERAACQYNYRINTHKKGPSESKSDGPFL